jgi:hypothetical protein
MRKLLMVAVMALLATVVYIPLSDAWGVAYETNRLTLQEGSVYWFYTSLQNMEGSAKEISIQLSGDTGIAQIVGASSYMLQPMTRGQPVYIKLTIPKPANRHYLVTAIYSANKNSESGVALGIVRSIDIEIETVEAPVYSIGAGGGSGGSSFTTINTTQTSQTMNLTGQDTYANGIIPTANESAGIDNEADVVSATSSENVQPSGNIDWIYAIILIITVSICGYLVYSKDLIGRLEWM